MHNDVKQCKEKVDDEFIGLIIKSGKNISHTLFCLTEIQYVSKEAQS